MLERNTNLSEIVRTGTPVNSAVNLEVLGTIFYEGTPLHDGAAIIENGRIKAAGCVLPLSNNLDLGKDMAPATAPAWALRRIRMPLPLWSVRRPASSPWQRTVC